MADNKSESETLQFHHWKVLIPELRRHTLSYLDKMSLFKYARCSKRSNEEIQRYVTKAPLSMEVKDLRDGVMIKEEYMRKYQPEYDRQRNPSVDIDELEALIEVKAEEGDLDAAEIAREELETLRFEYGVEVEDQYEMVRIAARLLDIREIPHGDAPVDDRKTCAETANLFRNHIKSNVRRVLSSKGIGDNQMENRRKERIERDDNERIEISFVAVGPNQHKMILNRPSDMEDGILEGNAVDAAYEYLAKRFKKKKNGRIDELILNYCYPSDEIILKNDFKSLSIPAGAITDMTIHAKIQQLISSTIETDIHIGRSSLISPGRDEFDKTMILGDLSCQPGVAQTGSKYALRRNDGGTVYVDFGGGDCQIKSLKTNWDHR